MSDNQKFEEFVSWIEGLTVLELSKLVKTLEERLGVSAAAPMAAAAAPAAASDAIAPEVVAVIAAAVASVAHGHRIISIKPMSTSWEKAGRHSVLTSHRIR